MNCCLAFKSSTFLSYPAGSLSLCGNWRVNARNSCSASCFCLIKEADEKFEGALLHLSRFFPLLFMALDTWSPVNPMTPFSLPTSSGLTLLFLKLLVRGFGPEPEVSTGCSVWTCFGEETKGAG